MKIGTTAGLGLALTALMATSGALNANAQGQDFAGAVYAMSNEFDGNNIVAYGRNSDGTLESIGSFATGGLGAAFDGGEGLDPLISAYALVLSPNKDFVLAVNAGSQTISALRIEDDYSLTLTSRARTRAAGPNSIAVSGDLVYVSNIDADGIFNGEPDQEGMLSGFRLSPEGQLTPIRGSARQLRNRPAAVQFSPDGQFLLVSSINSGSAALQSGSTDELVSYRVLPNGRLSFRPIGRTTSTFNDNRANRNLPSGIGFEVVESGGSQFVLVTEAREFQADGSPPAFPALQTGSVSVWRLEPSGAFTAIQLDVLAGDDLFDGQRTACWIEFSLDQSYFWVSNALESTLSTYSFDNGNITLLEEVAASGVGPADGDPFGTTDGWIDLWISEDGQYLYQLFGLDGTIGVFEVDGPSLTLIQEVSGDLPDVNTQGIVAI